MCLAVPGKLTKILAADAADRVGAVDFGGVMKDVSLAFTPEAALGDYVLVHAGFAISVIDEEEAHKTLALINEMEELDEEAN